MNKPSSLLILLCLALTNIGQAQDILGHEYELEAESIREGEQPVIPLDTSDPSYNVWRTLRDLSDDPAREPGIINVQKYDFGFSYNAIPTFFNMPVAMSPADLKASQVDIAVLGAVTDMGTGMRGAAHGPNAVRNSQVYGGYGARQPHMHVMVDPLEDLVVADFGINGHLCRSIHECRVAGFERHVTQLAHDHKFFIFNCSFRQFDRQVIASLEFLDNFFNQNFRC